MHRPNELNYYLYRDFYKKWSNGGSLYIREACDVQTPTDNVTIYGHNMKNSGTMFHQLLDYTEKEFWQEHRYIRFDTLSERHTYEIIATFKTSANAGEGFPYHLFINAENEAEFDAFVKTCKELAFYDTGVSASYGDKLITLSTCEYTLDNGRLVVVAKRID
jgi:sortase B